MNRRDSMVVDADRRLAVSPCPFSMRRTLRSALAAFPVRGRHRLVSMIGHSLGNDRELVNIGGLKVVIDHGVTSCRFMYYGLYEEHLVNWIARTIRQGDAVIEPGANIGYITGHLLSSLMGSGLLIALEPSRTCTDELLKNNHIASFRNLRLMNAAISASPGKALFWETPDIIAHGYGYLESANWTHATVGQAYEVATHSVDELMDQHGLKRIAFLKLDIEGSEWSAVQGAAKAITDRRIDHILVETIIEPGDRGQQWSVIDVLTRSGYRSHTMRRDGRLEPVDMEKTGRDGFRKDIMWSRL